MTTPQSLNLQLTPMQLLEASLTPAPMAWPQIAETPATPAQLRLCPDERSELVVQVRNPSRQALPLQIQVLGNFPTNWYRIELPTGSDHRPTDWSETLPAEALLPAGMPLDVAVAFRLPEAFFEGYRSADGAAQKLDYRGQVIVTEANSGRLLAAQSFSLHVRPHSKYLAYLPAVYREVDFIGRFLKLFEQSFDPSVQTLKLLWAYLDPLTAPAAMLPFLATWVGWPTTVPWSEDQQRRLIRNAMEIYRWRGTRRGLRLYLHLYTGLPLDTPDTPEADRHISIQEVFSRGFVMGAAHLDQDAVLGGRRPFHFIVRLRWPQTHTNGASRPAPPPDEALIRTIIEQEKPAFCTYDLQLESLPIPTVPSSP